ncbi:MAG: hypothetical protein AAFR31_06935 [Cyanobacteria bacterium J06627_8]
MNLAYPNADVLEALPESTQIRGIKGIYRILGFQQQRGIGRMYRAEKLPDGTPCTVREHVLPTAFFNEAEIVQRKQLFSALAGITLADGRSQDSRLVLPDEAIADPHNNRCYVITLGDLDTTPSLKDYQRIHTTFGESSVRDVLCQTLQTLECLHRQKFFLPNGQLQDGIVHGNLTLESLLLRSRTEPTTISKDADTSQVSASIEPGTFTIYVCDLSMWERVFDPAIASMETPIVKDDLRQLGRLAFSLLTGDRPHPETGAPLNPKHDDDWPSVSPNFQRYLQRLMGLHSPYATAEAARRDLLHLAPAPASPMPVPPPPPLDDKKTGFRLPWRLMLLLIMLACLAQLIAWLTAALRSQTEPLPQQLCCMSEVSGLPTGTFSYTSEVRGTWHHIRTEDLIERDKTLDQVIEERLASPATDTRHESLPQDNFVFTDSPTDAVDSHSQDEDTAAAITLMYESRPSFSAALQAVRQRQVDFLMAGITQASDIDVVTDTVAYDGLAAVVAFSYVQRSRGLPRSLDGQISFRQLRQLYTGKISNWQELGGPNLRVQLYLPNNTETLRIIEEHVLGDRRSIERFRQLLNDNQILLLPPLPMFRQMLQDFESNNLGAIALAPMSQVFGQCSVYPLAIQPNRRRPGISPLVDQDGRAIRPSVDLCRAKGSYVQNTTVFRNQTYPLAYPIQVVYRRDNRLLPIGSKFAELLKTEESQRLLQHAGLVPLRPLPTAPSRSNQSSIDEGEAFIEIDQAPADTTSTASPESGSG